MKQEIKTAPPTVSDLGDLLVAEMKGQSISAINKLKEEMKNNKLYKLPSGKKREIDHQQVGYNFWDQYWVDVYDGLKATVPDTEWRLRVFQRLQERNKGTNTSNHRFYNQELDCWFDHSALVKVQICGKKSWVPSNFQYQMTCCKIPHHSDPIYYPDVGGKPYRDRECGEWQVLNG